MEGKDLSDMTQDEIAAWLDNDDYEEDDNRKKKKKKGKQQKQVFYITGFKCILI